MLEVQCDLNENGEACGLDDYENDVFLSLVDNQRTVAQNDIIYPEIVRLGPGHEERPVHLEQDVGQQHPECVEFLQKCREKYSMKPNSKGDSDTYIICWDKIEASGYSMRCFVRCVDKKYARTRDKDLNDSIPNTVFKSKWGKEMAQTQATAAEAAETEPEATVATSDAAPDDDTANHVLRPMSFFINCSSVPHNLPVLPMSVYDEITRLCHGWSFLRLHPRVTLRPGLNLCRR
ncbi:hypothetical protein O3P69_010279 [Scylla paramamosain]|uniref:Uncharacterized protein n=1 Tax=Scylla paramamosain TaxID=85552 RepID=A0AAW0TRZ5_SCYPA